VRILVIGSGGREHALTLALARDPEVTSLHVAPGNAGIAELAETHQITQRQITRGDPAAITALAAKLAADLVVIGPEAPLVAGAADALREQGIACFGPGAAAAMIEGSKSFAKEVMAAAGIPTAAARTVSTTQHAEAALAEFGPPYVVKADGLAGGKGVLVTTDRKAAVEHARNCGEVVIEEFLDGPEVSLFALCDGDAAVPLLPAQDFKRAHDGDRGPNTGGMGAYAPLPWLPTALTGQVMDTVIEPTLAELRRRGAPYRGVLYAGLALTAAGPKVVEFNARFGDPETQVVLNRLTTPLAGLLHAAATGGLAAAPSPQWAPGVAVTVVIAAEGYPDNPVTGDLIEGVEGSERWPTTHVLHAGTARSPEGRLVSSGGRVLNVIGTGPDVAAARAAAYQAAERIRMRGGWYRRDIAERAASVGSTGGAGDN
jgi:phosphoribosylamine--glycine ligase